MKIDEILPRGAGIGNRSFVSNRKSDELCGEVLCFVRIARFELREGYSFAPNRKNEVVFFV